MADGCTRTRSPLVMVIRLRIQKIVIQPGPSEPRHALHIILVIVGPTPLLGSLAIAQQFWHRNTITPTNPGVPSDGTFQLRVFEYADPIVEQTRFERNVSGLPEFRY